MRGGGQAWRPCKAVQTRQPIRAMAIQPASRPAIGRACHQYRMRTTAAPEDNFTPTLPTNATLRACSLVQRLRLKGRLRNAAQRR